MCPMRRRIHVSYEEEDILPAYTYIYSHHCIRINPPPPPPPPPPPLPLTPTYTPMPSTYTTRIHLHILTSHTLKVRCLHTVPPKSGTGCTQIDYHLTLYRYLTFHTDIESMRWYSLRVQVSLSFSFSLFHRLPSTNQVTQCMQSTNRVSLSLCSIDFHHSLTQRT